MINKSRPRHVFLVLVALLCLVVPTACGRTPGSGDGVDGKVSLRISMWGNDNRSKITQQAIDAFVAANPDIEVSLEPAEWGSYWDRLATVMAANDAPDVIQMDEAYIAAYGSRGALLDLGTTSTDLDLSAMDPTVLDTGKVGGTQVGAPIGVANYSVAVNPSVLKKAGIAMPDDKTWTWDDLADISAKVSTTLASEGTYGIDGFGTGTAELGAWTRQHDEEIFPTDGKRVSAGTITSFFEYANRLIETKGAPPASLQVENASAPLDGSLFATNKAAFHLLFSTQVTAFGTASGQQMELLRLPRQAGGDSARMVNKASMYWSVSARTEHKEAAAKLTNFLLTDPAAVKLLTTERGIPAFPAVREQVATMVDPQAAVALKFTDAIAPELVAPPQVTPANASGWSSEFTASATEVTFGRVSPADGAAKTLSILDGLK